MLQIKGWHDHYENEDTRKSTALPYCLLPNKQSGLGYGRLLRMPRGAELYGAFIAVVLVASQQRRPNRNGYLSQDGKATGTPYSAEDLSIKTQMPVETVQEMIRVVSSTEIGWLHDVKGDDEVCNVQTCTPKAPARRVIPVEMPEGGWDVEDVVTIASFPDVGLIDSEARRFFDHFTGTAWKNSGNIDVCRSIAGLKAFLRKWKNTSPSFNKQYEPEKAAENETDEQRMQRVARSLRQ